MPCADSTCRAPLTRSASPFTSSARVVSATTRSRRPQVSRLNRSVACSVTRSVPRDRGDLFRRRIRARHAHAGCEPRADALGPTENSQVTERKAKARTDADAYLRFHEFPSLKQIEHLARARRERPNLDA